MLHYRPIELSEPAFHAAASVLWTQVCGPALALSPRALAYNTRPAQGGQQAGQMALVDGEPVGFVLASCLQGEPTVAAPESGWIDALAVTPEFQKRGIGGALLEWGEGWLRAQGCTAARLGGSLRPFAPGVPLELGSVDFFSARGYAARDENPEVRDLGRDLGDYTSPTFLRGLDVTLRPAGEGDGDALHAFLTREFPGRWRYELEQHVREGGRLSDYFLLQSERGMDACCLMTFEDSVRPVESYYPAPLPQPWGQVGSIGVSADRRRAGYGSALLDAALQHLRARGVRGCIIDWTHLVGYYERFGFQSQRRYLVLTKPLNA